MDEKESVPETPGEEVSQDSGDSSSVVKAEEHENAPDEHETAPDEATEPSELSENVSSDVKPSDETDVVDNGEEPKHSDSELQNHVDDASVTDAENDCESEKVNEDETASTTEPDTQDTQEDGKKDGMYSFSIFSCWFSTFFEFGILSYSIVD